MKQWNKTYVWLIGGILVSVLLIYGISYLYMIKPMKAEADMLSSEAAVYEKQYEKVTDQPGEEAENQELASVGLMVPNQKSPDDVLLNLQKVASSANVTIESIQSVMQEESLQEEENPTKSMNESVYLVDASSKSLNDINTFLEGVLKSDRLMIIDAMNVQQDGEQVYLTITFNAFYSG